MPVAIRAAKAVGSCLLVALAALWALRALGMRVVTSRRPVVVARTLSSGEVALCRSPKSTFTGPIHLVPAHEPNRSIALGPVVGGARGRVHRRATDGAERMPAGRWKARISAHAVDLPRVLPDAQPVDVAGRHGTLPAWFIPGRSGHWTIHIQGIRASRNVTIPSMAVTSALGHPSLAVTFRSSSELSEVRRSELGSAEWEDVADAVEHAYSSGATQVTLIGWSMGAAVALEVARRDPRRVHGMVLIGPVTDWGEVIRFGAQQARMPRWTGRVLSAFLGARVGALLLGLPGPIKIAELSWLRAGDVRVPTTVIHSAGDDTVPYSLSQAFAAAHPEVVTLVTLPDAPHAWEPSTAPELFEEAVRRALAERRA